MVGSLVGVLSNIDIAYYAYYFDYTIRGGNALTLISCEKLPTLQRIVRQPLDHTHTHTNVVL